MGVGTSSPQAKLHINSELAATNTINADASVLRLSRPSTTNVNWDNIAQFNLGSYAAATPNAETRLDLGLNNLENADSTFTKVMTWQANGNVGIGTTAPSGKLHVYFASGGDQPTWERTNTGSGSIGAYAGKYVLNNLTTASTSLVPNSFGVGFNFAYKSNTESEIFIGAITSRLSNYATNKGRMDFIVNGPTNGSDIAMTIDSNKNVGIGTTAPTSKLEVNGAATNNTSINTSNTTIDYSLSNLAATTNTASSITLSNIKNGGAYTLAFTSTAASGVVTFTASGFTFVYIGTVARTAGKKHIYNFVVIGTEVFVTMGTEN
jgi:hypothetical protein